jgi:hypothetical protein
MKKIICIFVLSICLLFNGCNTKSTLMMEAKIIYNMGGAQSVARQKFYLLNADPFAPNGAKFQEKYDAAKTNEEKVVLTLASTLLFSLQKFASDKQIKAGEEKVLLGIVDKTKIIWGDYLVKEVITDFDGKASFDDVPPGKYWIFSQSETRAAFALWNLPIELKSGENKILLDQNNAVYSK